MPECHRQWVEKEEQEQRREEWEREAKLRCEEVRQELALCREEAEREERLMCKEMKARGKDSELLTSCFMQIAKAYFCSYFVSSGSLLIHSGRNGSLFFSQRL